MNGHSSNIGYIFISFTKFFLKVYLVGSTPAACAKWFFHDKFNIYHILVEKVIPTPIACEGRRSF